MKLNQFISQKFTNNHLNNTDLEKKLIALLPQIFPNNEDLYNIDMDDKNKKGNYIAKYLPFNTRDAEWLANFIANIIRQLQTELSQDGKKSAYRALGVVTAADVKPFVENSREFAAARDVYEQSLVKAYIKLLRNNTHNDFYTTALEKQVILKHKRCSQLFRNRICEAMNFLGIAENNIEIGIESNRYMWYARMQKHTFDNAYEKNPVFQEHYVYIYRYLRKELTHVEYILSQFRTNYFNLDNYRYYTAHKAVIDKVGTAKSNMKISRGEAVRLAKKTNELFIEYKRLVQNLLSKVKIDRGIEK